MTVEGRTGRYFILGAIILLGAVLRVLYASLLLDDLHVEGSSYVNPFLFAFRSVPFLAVLVLLLYRWATLGYSWSVAWLACCFAACHPYLMYFDSKMAISLTPFDGLLAVTGLLMLANLNVYPRAAWSRVLTAGVFVFVLYLVLTRGATLVSDWHDPVWRFWKFAAAEASLQHILVAYLSDGPLYGLGIIGAWFTVRDRPALLILPVALILLSWWLSVLRPLMVSRGAVVHILSLYASVGFWELYRGLGRTAGHGILAVDPIPKGPGRNATDRRHA